ncbi:retinol dehydrogenase 11-like [Oratosquilla oratoria]|uniref:retinol dehydrogenase 11-like n=1 Tax=Oratosquilla oratoria TaxID=337810 RepID=UPI003F76591B
MWQMLLYITGCLVVMLGLLVVVKGWEYRQGIGWCTSQASMEGKVVLITGASAGLGKETALDLARRGARVIMACRNLQKAAKVSEEIRKATGNNLVEVQLLDTSSLASVRKFAKNFLKNEKRLDVLILNAGIIGPSKLTFTDEDNEITIATNHLGHFLLTNILLGLMKKSSPSRIVTVSSRAHTVDESFDIDNINVNNKSYPGSRKSYCYSKLCNVLFTKQLSQYLEGAGISCNALCPGVVGTEIFIKGSWDIVWIYYGVIALFSKTPLEGAQTLIHVAVSEEAETKGEYYDNCKVIASSPLSNDLALAKKLWEKSEYLVDLKPEERHY